MACTPIVTLLLIALAVPLGAQGKAEVVVWLEGPWTDTRAGARLPADEDLARPWAMTLCRNDTEQAIVGLLNRGDRPVELTVSVRTDLPADRSQVELLAMGAIEARGEGIDWWREGKVRTGLINLFTAEQVASFGGGFPKRFIGTDAWAEFPKLVLMPGEPVRIWLRVRAFGAGYPEPGRYSIRLAATGDSADIQQNVAVRVLKVTLPREPVIESITYGTVDDEDAKLHHVTVNGGYRRWAFGNLLLAGGFWSEWVNEDKPLLKQAKDDPATFRRRIGQAVENLYAQHQTEGLPKSRCVLEICDEPGDDNVADWMALAETVRAVDPEARIIANPPHDWEGGHTTFDITIRPMAHLVDVWEPHSDWFAVPEVAGFLKGEDKPLWFYNNIGLALSRYEPAVNHFYRQAGWIALKHGLQGIGIWSAASYYGDPWDDFDEGQWGIDWPDAAIVFPSEAGAIATRNWEAWRETIEDVAIYRMLGRALREGMIDERDVGRAGDWLAETPDLVLGRNQETEGQTVTQAVAEALEILDRAWAGEPAIDQMLLDEVLAALPTDG